MPSGSPMRFSAPSLGGGADDVQPAHEDARCARQRVAVDAALDARREPAVVRLPADLLERGTDCVRAIAKLAQVAVDVDLEGPPSAPTVPRSASSGAGPICGR